MMPINITKKSIPELRTTADELSRRIIRMTTAAGSGHPSSSLSAIDLLTVLYFGGVMRYNPRKPAWTDRDRFILSKGHAAPALYAVLAEAGFFKTAMLGRYRTLGSPLEGHPNMRVLSGVEASTGSLGQGLSIGLGHALAARVDGRDWRVNVMIGDGEADEGQVWEAAMTAAKYRTGNLTAILDRNGFQQTGPVSAIMPSLEPLAAKWQAFGWDVLEIDGHDIEQIVDAFTWAADGADRPHMIIAQTRKGRGLSPFEQDSVSRKHGTALTEQEAALAIAELDSRSCRSTRNH